MFIYNNTLLEYSDDPEIQELRKRKYELEKRRLREEIEYMEKHYISYEEERIEKMHKSFAIDCDGGIANDPDNPVLSSLTFLSGLIGYYIH